MLKLKGQTESGEWVEFWIYNMVRCNKMFAAAECIDPVLSEEIFEVMNIITDTIQPGIDVPRKQMLDEIRQSLKGLMLVQGKGLPLGYPCDWVDAILDEMEAKL